MARYFEYYAGAADKLEGKSVPLGEDKLDVTSREPYGVSGRVIPWNFPLSITARGFVDRIVDRAESYSLGSGTDNPDMGPLNHAEHFEAVLEYVDIGLEEGATIAIGGDHLDRDAVRRDETERYRPREGTRGARFVPADAKHLGDSRGARPLADRRRTRGYQ